MSLSSFIFENIDLTIPFYEDSIPDINMIVQFIVNVDSTISDIEIVKNQSLGSGNEISVIRAIKATSGLWTPALEGGKPVAELIRLPIRICPF